jgi:hypothetical protein
MPKLTRRKFLKHLAFAVGASAIAPAALAKVAAAPTGQWVTYAIRRPLKASPIEGDSTLCADEERLEFEQLRVYEDTIIVDQRRKPRKNPLFRGEIGIFDDCIIHRLKNIVV